MRTTTGSVHKNSPTQPSQAYHPSVPLSVYRELAMELQAAQAKLDALTTKNQQLAQENQVLRQEIFKVVESFSHLQNFVDSSAIFTKQQAYQPSGKVKSPTKQPVTPVPPPHKVSHPRPPQKKRQEFSPRSMEINYPIPDPVFIEEQEVAYYATAELNGKQLNGWWLIITILLIMLTAFTAGYLIVRPLFEHQKR
ncbi:MAG: cell division protein ZapB [Nostoc sp. ChiSLP02]|nr:cell division protein ZapB [Nostoc sp. DedSLP05]MDZ8100911.1 cell division protein ZapB [Nostoc sp. DedSLP01]MDZ8188560.1 cell division protein ZapB [Nostoc sp. ChiSLP02]